MRIHPIVASLLPWLLFSGCSELGLDVETMAEKWDDYQCDRRVGVIENLRLDTMSYGKSWPTNATRVANYNRAINYLYSRRVNEVSFEGRTTSHGALGEFMALNAGFSSIPNPAYSTPRNPSRLKITWKVPRSYHFDPSDVEGKYHPSTFWRRVFGTDWSDGYVDYARTPVTDEGPIVFPRLLVRSYYGARCHVQQVAYVTIADSKTFTRKTTQEWRIVREWDEPEK